MKWWKIASCCPLPPFIESPWKRLHADRKEQAYRVHETKDGRGATRSQGSRAFTGKQWVLNLSQQLLLDISTDYRIKKWKCTTARQCYRCMLDFHAHNIEFTTLWICCDMLVHLFTGIRKRHTVLGMSNTAVSGCLEIK